MVKHFFLDTSALIKPYRLETGTKWGRQELSGWQQRTPIFIHNLTGAGAPPLKSQAIQIKGLSQLVEKFFR